MKDRMEHYFGPEEEEEEMPEIPDPMDVDDLLVNEETE